MRYELEEDIQVPRERVLELFLDTENLKKWQPSLVSYSQISGDSMRGVGSQCRQVHKMGNREVDMIATVTVDEYPEDFAARFEADGMTNIVANRFEEMGALRTRWTVTTEFQTTSIMMKIMMVLMPFVFKSQTRKFMVQFRDFVESHPEA